MAVSFDPEFSDVVNENYIAGSISVTTSAIEAKVGGSRLAGRETLRIFNNSNTTIYFGPSGVTSSTGEPIFKRQWVNIPAGDQLGIFLITASGTASDVRIQELG